MKTRIRWWPPRVVPPKGAHNVLLIMTDDVGFGAPSTFGGGTHASHHPTKECILNFRPVVPISIIQDCSLS